MNTRTRLLAATAAAAVAVAVWVNFAEISSAIQSLATAKRTRGARQIAPSAETAPAAQPPLAWDWRTIPRDFPEPVDDGSVLHANPATMGDALLETESGGAATASADLSGRRHPREPAIFDELRNSKGKPIPESVRKLAEEITKDATNDVGRARAIYDWITANIVYDTEEWDHIVHGGETYSHEHDPESVLKRGMSVCIGYAWLFNSLCEAEGIESTWLIGDVRGYRGTADDELVSAFRHAWNAVKLEDGEWHLLDATWGAVQAGETPKATAARADYYFDTPADQFVYDHLPEDESWQLLEEPVPAETAFSVLPNLKPTFFTNGLRLGADYTSALRSKAGGQAALLFSAPAGVDVAATFGTSEGGFKRIPVVETPDGSMKGAVLPQPSRGEYILRIYSGKSSPVLECSADFLIKVE